MSFWGTVEDWIFCFAMWTIFGVMKLCSWTALKLIERDAVKEKGEKQ